MCFNQPKPPDVKPPAPPPPTPPPPEPPKPLPVEPKKLESEEKTKPNVQYGKKKSSAIKAKKGTDSLKIPLNSPQAGGSSGGLNVP